MVGTATRMDIAWSKDNGKLALINYQNCTVSVFSLEGETDQPVAVIQENCLIGIERAIWSPDSKHILIVLKHRVDFFDASKT